MAEYKICPECNDQKPKKTNCYNCKGTGRIKKARKRKRQQNYRHDRRPRGY